MKRTVMATTFKHQSLALFDQVEMTKVPIIVGV